VCYRAREGCDAAAHVPNTRAQHLRICCMLHIYIYYIQKKITTLTRYSHSSTTLSVATYFRSSAAMVSESLI
jgi:hypothetical protein